MPQRDPSTGKRLSGAALVRKRVAQELGKAGVASSSIAAQLDKPAADGRAHYAELPPPPVSDTIDACEAWANGLALLAATAAEAGIDPVRTRVLRKAVAKLGRMKTRARISALAVEARYMKALESDGDPAGWKAQLTAEKPPVRDAIAGAAWAFLRLCKLAATIAAEERVDEGLRAGAIDALANVISVECTRLQRAERSRPARGRR